jgi:hypothetical protein
MTAAARVFNRRHTIIPEEDTTWVLEQKPCVLKFWHQCWLADSSGQEWMPLTTTLSYSAFRQAKKLLSENGLFNFMPNKSIQDGRKTVCWMVKNLHGSEMRDFWEGVDSEKQEPDDQERKAGEL